MKIADIVSWLEEVGYSFSFKCDKDCDVKGFSSLRNYKPGTITWVKKSANYEKYMSDNGIDSIPVCAIIQEGVEISLANTIISDNSKGVFFEVIQHFWGEKAVPGSIGEGTVIKGNTNIDKSVILGCNCTITGEIRIGSDTVIEHNVVIQGRVTIGERCVIQSGTVIGIGGFGYSQNLVTKEKRMVEHFGGVVIGNDVYIGCNSSICRGTIDDTIIGSGVKISQHSHIAHNSTIGDNTTVLFSNIYGSSSIGDRSFLSACTVANQVTVGADTVIGMGSVVNRSIEDNVIAYGLPAKVIRKNDSGL